MAYHIDIQFKMIRSNKDLIIALHEIWNTGNIRLVPEIYDEGFIAHWPKGWGVEDSVGYDGVNKASMRIQSAFPDWREKLLI